MKGRRGGGGILRGGLDCRISSGGVIGRGAWRGYWRRRYCLLLVSGAQSLKMATLTDFVDAEVIGLWAKIEKAVYDALDDGKGGDRQDKQQDDDHKSARENGGWDGYHQEFVANNNR